VLDTRVVEAHDDLIALYRWYLEECLRLGVRAWSPEEMEGLLLMIAPGASRRPRQKLNSWRVCAMLHRH